MPNPNSTGRVYLSTDTAVKLGRMMNDYHGRVSHEHGGDASDSGPTDLNLARVCKNGAPDWPKGSWRLLNTFDGFTNPATVGLLNVYNGLGEIKGNAVVVAILGVGGYIAIAAECGDAVTMALVQNTPPSPMGRMISAVDLDFAKP